MSRSNRSETIRFFRLLITAICFFALAGLAMAGANITEKGTLETVEENGRFVTIVKKADNVDKVVREYRAVYEMTSRTIILDGFGKKSTLERFQLPSQVEYVVEYTQNGPVIKKIREIPQ
jgi:hypothetical protein